MSVNISDKELDLFNKNGFSDDDVKATVDNYRSQGLDDNSIRQKIDVRLKEWNFQPTNNVAPQEPQVEQTPIDNTPITPVNNTVSGGVQSNTWMDKNGVIHREGEVENTNPISNVVNSISNTFRNFGNKRMAQYGENEHPYLSSFLHGVGNNVVAIPQIVNTLVTGNSNHANEAIRDNWNRLTDYDKPRNAGQKIANLGGEILPWLGVGIGEGITKGITSQAEKVPALANFIAKHPKMASYIFSLPASSAEGAMWGAGDYGARKLQGIDDDTTLLENIRNGAIAGPVIHTGANGAKAVISGVANKVGDKLSNTKVGNNIRGSIANFLNIKSKNPEVNKYSNLDKTLAQGNSNASNRMTKEQRAELENSKNISKRDSFRINKIMRHGLEDEKLSPKMQRLIYSTNKKLGKEAQLESAPKWVDTLPKYSSEEQAYLDGKAQKWDVDKLPHLKKDELSPVKNETDINTPKADKTLENGQSIPTQNENAVKEEPVKTKEELHKEKIQRQRERMNSDVSKSNTTSSDAENLVKFDEEGLEKLGQDMHSWLYPSKAKKGKITRLESGTAEGVEEPTRKVVKEKESDKPFSYDDWTTSNLHTQEKPMDLPSDKTEDLQKEIDQWNEKDFNRRQEKLKVDEIVKDLKSEPQNIRLIHKIEDDYLSKDSKMKFKTGVRLLCSLKTSKEVGRAIHKLYNNATSSEQKAIEQIVKKNGSHYKLVKTQAEDVRISEINNTIKNNAELFSVSNRDNNGNRVYTNKRVTKKLKDVIKGNEILERHFRKIGDIDVHFEDTKPVGKTNGFYSNVTNSITIYTDCDNVGVTLAHEARHAVQRQLKDASKFSSRWRKLHKSCEKRNKELIKFTNNDANNEVVEKVKPLYKALNSGKISVDDYVKQVTRDETETYLKYERLLKRYRNAYLEKDARGFAGGDYGKRLFHKGEYSIRSGLHRTKSTYNRANKRRYGLNDFGELADSTNKNEVQSVGFRQGTRRTLVEGTRGKSNEGLRKSTIEQSGKSKIPNSYKKGNIAFRKDLSVDSENIGIELGLFTKEQAKNRIAQQSDSGRGYYEPRVYKSTDDKIHLEKDYNALRDEKQGISGRSTQGDTQEAFDAYSKTNGAIQENIRRHHVKDVIDLVENDFAKPIPKEGKVPNDYIAVNKTLLATAVYGNFTKAWYETVSSGEEAIAKAFKNEKQAQGWKDLYNRANKDDFMIPQKVFNKLFNGSGEKLQEYWNRYSDTHRPQAMWRTAGLILDYMNERWKRGVLTSSSFVLNNRLGNQMMLAAHSDNPIQYAKSLVEAFKLKQKDIPSELLDNSMLEATNDFRSRRAYSGYQPLDNALNLFNGHLIDTSKLDGAKFVGSSTANLCIGLPNKVFNSVCDKLMEFNSKLEYFERKQAFALELNKSKKELAKKLGQQMITTEEAIKHLDKNPEMMSTVVERIENVLGDYNNFTNAEKKVIKKIVPFYSWYRTISRNTLHLIKDNPTRFAFIMLELNRMKDRDELVKDYQKGSIKTGITDNRSGKELVINKQANAVPWNTFENIGDDTKNFSLVSPAIKVPLEAGMGKHFFRNGEITSKRYMRNKDFATGKDYYLDKETMEKLDSLPASVRVGYLAKELGAKTAYPMLNSKFFNLEVLPQTFSHNKTEPDKIYDADFGGYYNGEHFAGDKNRYAANNISERAKMLNRLVGLSLQNKSELNKEERKKLIEKWKKQQRRMK